MKTRISTIALVSILSVVLLTACGAVSDLSLVSDNGKAFMAALRDGDHNASWNLLDPSLQTEIGTYTDWVDFATPRNFSESKFSSTNVSGSQATMEGEAVIEGTTYLVTLVFNKSGDNWLISGIDFSQK
jgi:hypothetical protein